jgi:hypothetical protein
LTHPNGNVHQQKRNVISRKPPLIWCAYQRVYHFLHSYTDRYTLTCKTPICLAPLLLALHSLHSSGLLYLLVLEPCLSLSSRPVIVQEITWSITSKASYYNLSIKCDKVYHSARLTCKTPICLAPLLLSLHCHCILLVYCTY